MKSIKAINNHVVVKELIKSEEVTKSGIIMPSTVKVEPQKYGEVLSVGEKVENVKVGDIVVFHQAGGQVASFDGEIQRILKNEEIYGILQDK